MGVKALFSKSTKPSWGMYRHLRIMVVIFTFLSPKLNIFLLVSKAMSKPLKLLFNEQLEGIVCLYVKTSYLFIQARAQEYSLFKSYQTFYFKRGEKEIKVLEFHTFQISFQTPLTHQKRKKKEKSCLPLGVSIQYIYPTHQIIYYLPLSLFQLFFLSFSLFCTHVGFYAHRSLIGPMT